MCNASTYKTVLGLENQDNGVYMYGYVCLCTGIFKQKKTFSVCIVPYKHERGWENSQQLFKPETIRLGFV